MNKHNLFSSVCYGENRKSQVLFIFDGILINAAAILTTGVFLSGYIVYLGGSDFLVGLLNNSPNWASIAAILSSLIFEKMKRRKKLLFILNVSARILICSIIFLPVLFKGDNIMVPISAVMIVAGNIIWGVYSIGITVMMIGLIDNVSRNQYIYVRMFWLRTSFTIATIAMGFVLDHFNKGYTGFLVVYLTSLILSLADAFVISKVDEPVYNVRNDEKFDIRLFLEPLKSRNYRKYIIFVFMFYLCLTVSTSFTPLYLIRYLNFDYGFISSINVINYILMIFCTRFWSKIEREKGLSFVIKVTSILVAAEVFIYSFLTEGTYYLLYIAPIISGIGYSGFNISIMTYRYSLMPENNRTIYEGWFNAVYGLSTLISPVIGSFLMKVMPLLQNNIYKHSDFQILYLLSSICTAVIIQCTFDRYKGLNMKKAK